MSYSNEEQQLLDFIKGFVNDVNDHDIDTDLLLPDIKNIISEIEDLAMQIEKGKYERNRY